MANNLIRFNRIGDLARFDPFGNFGDLLSNFNMTPFMTSDDFDATIRVDLTETDEQYCLRAEMPGVRKEDIKVDINGNNVSISAEVKKEADTSDSMVIRSERYYGQQSRYMTLAQDIDEKRADATYQDGILTLTLPKKTGSTSCTKLVVH